MVLACGALAAEPNTTGEAESACGSVSAAALPGTRDKERAAAATAEMPTAESFWVLFRLRRRPEMLDADIQAYLFESRKVLTEDEDGRRFRISVGDDCNC